MDKVKKLYEHYNEYERLLLHRMEFYINLRYIKENLLEDNLKILDLGGGVGRYAVELTKAGHEVTLIDLSETNIKEANRLCKEESVEIYQIQQGNALDLTFLQNNNFDVILAMGPFYHIKEENQRIQCINEIKRVLKDDGTLFSAHITRCAFYKYIVANVPHEIDKFYENFSHILKHGIKKNSDGDLFTDICYCENAEQVFAFMEKCGFENSEIIASEGLVSNIEEKLQDLDDDKFSKIAELNYKFCKDIYILNAASHLLYKGTKGKVRK